MPMWSSYVENQNCGSELSRPHILTVIVFFKLLQKLYDLSMTQIHCMHTACMNLSDENTNNTMLCKWQQFTKSMHINKSNNLPFVLLSIFISRYFARRFFDLFMCIVLCIAVICIRNLYIHCFSLPFICNVWILCVMHWLDLRRVHLNV